MKPTGIIRRIDDLGRVVIPKEVRKTAMLKEGDPLEIFLDKENNVLLKKYCPIDKITNFADNIAKSLSDCIGRMIFITSSFKITNMAGSTYIKNYFTKLDDNKSLSSQLQDFISRREPVLLEKTHTISIRDGDEVEFASQLIVPIVLEGDAIGSIILASTDDEYKISEADIQTVKFAIGILKEHL